MIVIFDTCELFNKWFLDTATLQTIKSYATVMIPEVVLDELKNKYRQHLKEKIESFHKAKDALMKFQESSRCCYFPIDAILFDTLTVKDKCKEHPCAVCDTEIQFVAHKNRILNPKGDTTLFMELSCIKSEKALVDEYSSFLNKVIDGKEIFIIDYPTTSHKDIVDCALRGEKPFSGDGKKGYRDFLIWQSILAVANRETPESIHFISSNKNDFSDGNRKWHPDLKAQIPESKTVEYWENSDKFFEAVIQPILNSDEEFKTSVERETIIAKISNNTMLLDSIKEMVFREAVGLDFMGGEIIEVFDYPIDDDRIDIDISRISINDEYLMKITIPALCEVESYLTKNDFDAFPDKWKRQLNITETADNDGYITITEESEVDFYVQMIFRQNNQAIEGLEIKKIIAEDGACDYCPDYEDEEDDEGF